MEGGREGLGKHTGNGGRDGLGKQTDKHTDNGEWAGEEWGWNTEVGEVHEGDSW